MSEPVPATPAPAGTLPTSRTPSPLSRVASCPSDRADVARDLLHRGHLSVREERAVAGTSASGNRAAD
eukprot:11685365-Karenia_brevis.AAC.1